jgi:hypothetical protein
LNSARYTDGFIEEIWNFIQSDPSYKDKTTMILTCDHGRGTSQEDWRHHGIKIKEADQIWLGVIGPDTPPIGEVKGDCQYYQSQVAKTLAAFLKLDYKNDKPVGEIIKPMAVAR